MGNEVTFGNTDGYQLPNDVSTPLDQTADNGQANSGFVVTAEGKTKFQAPGDDVAKWPVGQLESFHSKFAPGVKVGISVYGHQNKKFNAGTLLTDIDSFDKKVSVQLEKKKQESYVQQAQQQQQQQIRNVLEIVRNDVVSDDASDPVGQAVADLKSTLVKKYLVWGGVASVLAAVGGIVYGRRSGRASERAKMAEESGALSRTGGGVVEGVALKEPWFNGWFGRTKQPARPALTVRAKVVNWFNRTLKSPEPYKLSEYTFTSPVSVNQGASVQPGNWLVELDAHGNIVRNAQGIPVQLGTVTNVGNGTIQYTLEKGVDSLAGKVGIESLRQLVGYLH